MPGFKSGVWSFPRQLTHTKFVIVANENNERDWHDLVQYELGFD